MYPHWVKEPGNETEWSDALARLARYLRTPEGCPWDREQSAEDFAKFAREELDELLEAFASGDNAHIEEEFGDVFFVLLASMAGAEEEGRFTFESALKRIHKKMIRRHDHVFGEEKAQTPEEAIAAWEKVKAEEKGEQPK
jgi:uncharacterized protein YabN with tetrapyrrole methylase and pyrophosphatase domain